VLVSKEETQEQFDLEWKFNRLLLDARRIPDFENFLKPKAYDELLAAASEGPVIVLVGTDPTYDAVTLQISGVDAVFLPGLRSRIINRWFEPCYGRSKACDTTWRRVCQWDRG